MTTLLDANGNNALTITIGTGDKTVSAANLNTIDGITTVAVNAANVTTISSSTLDSINTLYSSSGVSGLGNEAITVSDTGSIAASTLSAIAAVNTTGTITATAAATVTGTAAEIVASFGNSTITEANDVAINVNSGTASLAQARSMDGFTTGTVTATIEDTRVSDLLGSTPLLDTNSNNAFTITIGTADAEITAANLNSLNAKTSVAIEAGNVTKITGTVAASNTAYAAAGNSQINGLGNETVVISGESSNKLSDASTLNTLDGYTTGTVNAGSLVTIQGDLSDLLTAYASNGITGLGNEAITLDDTTTVAATDLNTLDSKTSGDITTHSSLQTLTGTVAALNTAYSSEGIKVLGNEKVTVSDTTLDAGDLNVLNNYTTGLITATAVTTLTGTLADVNAAYASVAVSGDAITGLANEAVELTDTRVLAADLKTLNTKTTGTIDASTISVIEGTAADVNTVYDAAGSTGDKISGLGSEEITLTDTTVSATALRDIYLDGSTVRNNGTIDASSIHTISGSGTTISVANDVFFLSNGVLVTISGFLTLPCLKTRGALILSPLPVFKILLRL